MSVIERAEQRLAEEERQHETGADNQCNLNYWAAYLDGARAQKKEGGELAMSALNYVERQGFMAGMGYAGMTEEKRETLLKELRDLPVGSVAPLVVEHDYEQLVKALRCPDFADVPCGNHECKYFDAYGCKARVILNDAAAAIEALQAEAQLYKNLAEEWQEAAERKERLLGMYRAQNIYSAKDSSGNLITNLCSLNRSESPNSPENPDS